ncbi:NAD(P)-dependent dehydrogenase (short-subunit alcohol dehydrogenase family) [Pseudomonas citronellolis]|uniref:SDR family NAD(P)-dependent oxidoreductase n=1 Tax=Pseudomonas citronellolis TaxID=53408 RepID=UPI0020A1A228|nr:SDR family oxidoreductase [Pseudomonas citronellolis]MCP1645516.1 NAD(P)-dependent dehydrogenase (short-subunit alcohol dehydrogenase family) [Pseudomonas citronellolis]MCP1668357.1 NAD(P)-dependent dehydrogenase (short-subunit alcohol dehydrogenase family) [Pseudomonas citronellolis]MCP1700731.1 NAD(P)-dependent dehydrogenase (short-subunit alcohol dehydrogenase family) [Pseudomonas citronellolis]MCP1706276.1 NAD(P)-dependent dehydrogenase (short-subunit alcohol dehydrogenase family) [Pseud
MSELFSLAGKAALITGATRGIGLAIAREYGRAGARLAISSENAEDCARSVAQLAEEGIEALALPADLRDPQAVQRLAEQALARLGGLDALVCNAGVAPHMGPLATASDADWELTLTVNLRSALWLTNALLPAMAARGGGSVVLMASIAGVRGNKGLGLYGLSKAGLAQLARNLAVEWGPANIRVNAISPGVIQTAFARPLTDNPEVLRRRLALTPLRRVGRPEEVAALALLLAAPGGAFISGQNLIVDGGTTIGDGN